MCDRAHAYQDEIVYYGQDLETTAAVAIVNSKDSRSPWQLRRVFA
jgi:hypothetical protein